MAQGEDGVLSGVRVVEYADFVSGPYSGRHLAELGAEVIKVEPPGFGDSARRTGPYAHDDPASDNSLLFNYLNVNKLGVTLNLQSETGREWFLKLLEDADVFLYGGSAGQLDRLRLSYREVCLVTPRIIGVYLTPFGLSGPYRDFQGGELVMAHVGGLASVTAGALADPDRPPLKPGGHQALMIAGLYGAMATLHALFARETTGQGQEVDVSEFEAVTSFQAGGMIRQAFSREATTREAQGSFLYPAQDGTVAINPMQDYMWRAMAGVMGNPEWADRPEFSTRAGRTANRRELFDLVSGWTSQFLKEELYQRLQGARVPAFPTNTVADVLRSEHLRERGFFEEVPLPSGEKPLAPGRRYRLPRGMPGGGRAAPRLGEHTAQVLTERLGLAREDLVTAFELGVI
ncbi:MAG: CoA transferase [Chloroflexi bacterium]|nr:CoA transferase [Chloroflexota bacterium]